MRTITTKCISLLAGLLLLAPAAHAQLDEFSLSIGSIDDYIDPSNSTQIDVTVEAACGLVLQQGSTVDVTVDGEGYVASDGATIELNTTDCIGSTSGSVSGDGTVTLEPVAGAMGLEPFNITFDAALGDASDSETVDGVQLDYLPGHIMDPAGDQTWQVTNGTVTFPLEVEITANAKSMVMFERTSASAGSVSGFSSFVFDVPNGVREKTYQVTWKAPSGPWEEETVTFYTYSHCLDKDPCPEHDPAEVTWTFVNAGGNDTNGSADDGEESPGVALIGVLFVIGLLAVSRRRE